MRNVSRAVFLLVVIMLGGGAVFLATWDIPAPVNKVERVLPDDRFPR
ncbi:MAG TPA: hypothetical protein VIG92_07920 [Rhodospirillales bacterium]